MRKIIGLLALALVYFVLNHTSLLTPEADQHTPSIASVQDLSPIDTIAPPPDTVAMPASKPKLADVAADEDDDAIAADAPTTSLADTKAASKPLSVAVDEQAPKQAASTGLVSADEEINKTLKLIKQGGPFPHKQDATIFQNRERILPKQPHGYYHEYTVRTPGTKTRGARRIVTGGNPPQAYYYTPDHYRTFHKLEANHDLP